DVLLDERCYFAHSVRFKDLKLPFWETEKWASWSGLRSGLGDGRRYAIVGSPSSSDNDRVIGNNGLAFGRVKRYGSSTSNGRGLCGDKCWYVDPSWSNI